MYSRKLGAARRWTDLAVTPRRIILATNAIVTGALYTQTGQEASSTRRLATSTASMHLPCPISIIQPNSTPPVLATVGPLIQGHIHRRPACQIRGPPDPRQHAQSTSLADLLGAPNTGEASASGSVHDLLPCVRPPISISSGRWAQGGPRSNTLERARGGCVSGPIPPFPLVPAPSLRGVMKVLSDRNRLEKGQPTRPQGAAKPHFDEMR